MPALPPGTSKRTATGTLRALRVALVSEPFYPDVGGMPEHVHNLACQLARRGHDVTVVTTAYPAAPGLMPRQAPYRVVRLGRATSHIMSNGSQHHVAVGWRLRSQMQALLSSPAFDIVHVHGPIFPTLSLLAIQCAPAGSKLVGTLHTHFAESAALRLLRRPLQRYLDALDGIITVHENALRSLQRVGFRCPATRIENGVDLQAWAAGRPMAALRDGRFNILVQARLEPRNHIATLLSAMVRLDASTRDRLRVVVIGDGPDRARLQKMAAGLHVDFVGAQLDRRVDYAQSCDAYYFSAAIASHPMSLLEGMAAARPILAHDIDGVRELVTDGVEGFLLPLNDAAAMAQALRKLLGLSPAQRAAMAQAAHRRAEPFAWEHIADRILAYYRALLDGKDTTADAVTQTG